MQKCRVANCEQEAKWICVESLLRYCGEHRHPHQLDSEHPHHYISMKEYRRRSGFKQEVNRIWGSNK